MEHPKFNIQKIKTEKDATELLEEIEKQEISLDELPNDFRAKERFDEELAQSLKYIESNKPDAHVGDSVMANYRQQVKLEKSLLAKTPLRVLILNEDFIKRRAKGESFTEALVHLVMPRLNTKANFVLQPAFLGFLLVIFTGVVYYQLKAVVFLRGESIQVAQNPKVIESQKYESFDSQKVQSSQTDKPLDKSLEPKTTPNAVLPRKNASVVAKERIPKTRGSLNKEFSFTDSPQIAFKITEQSLVNLKDENIQRSLLDKLATLKDVEFTENDFLAAIEQRLELDKSVETIKLLSLIKTYSIFHKLTTSNNKIIKKGQLFDIETIFIKEFYEISSLDESEKTWLKELYDNLIQKIPSITAKKVWKISRAENAEVTLQINRVDKTIELVNLEKFPKRIWVMKISGYSEDKPANVVDKIVQNLQETVLTSKRSDEK